MSIASIRVGTTYNLISSRFTRACFFLSSKRRHFSPTFAAHMSSSTPSASAQTADEGRFKSDLAPGQTLKFEVVGQFKKARAARVHLPHGVVETPVFM